MRKTEAGGKLNSTPTMAGIGVANRSNRLCVIDVDSRERFLVDTGADISVLAAKNKKQSTSSAYKLYAANNTPIRTYGEKTLTLNLGLRRCFRWTFIIADVKTSILGADFLRHNKLLIDLHQRKLVDRVTELSIKANNCSSTESGVYMIGRNHAYHNILKQYPDVLRPMSLKSPAKHNVVHHIETTGPPLYARPRPLPPDKYKAAKLEFERMLDMGICQPSKSPWASPLHVVKKKDGSLRVCGDYRRLNAVTQPDRYPIPRIQDFTYQLHGKKIFSKLDLKMAYYWIPISREDAEKTAIITPFGLFEFNCMTFGLRNASQTFQRFMHEALRGLHSCFAFVDDVLVFSENEEQHKQHLQEVLQRLNDYGVTLNLSKCEFGKTKINFLGYEVSAAGIQPTEERIEAISNYPKPKNIQELRRFLGMLNFYRDCLPHQAELQTELNKFLHNKKKNDKTPVDWTPHAEQAFNNCRQSILEATLLSHPVANKPLCMMTDASDRSIGAVLQMKIDNTWKPLAFFSKTMSETQRRYSVYDRELLAMYAAVKHFRRLIEGNDVIIYTDHKPLTYALTRADSTSDTPRRERQLHFISQFCTAIKYVKGENNAVADALSRVEEISCPSVIDFMKLADDQNEDEELNSLRKKPNLKFTDVTLPGLQRPITCEISTSTPRPYLPTTYRFVAFKAQHDLCHPGVRTTRKQIAAKYFWPHMNQDTANWARSCIACQRAKIYRHTVTPLGEFPQSQRFEHLHIDIVGPLQPSNEYRYCVTMIDRFTKWPEAVPVRDITAAVVAKALYDGWIARFGCPLRITTDQGRQFESSLFKSLMRKFGITRLRTTAYHPQANGQVERWHRTLKTALMARCTTTEWAQELPTVLLGLRTALRADNNLSPALMTYGATLRLPADFFAPSKTNTDDCEFVQQLIGKMASLVPAQSRNISPSKLFIQKDLATCTHVFLRNDSVRPPLSPPYDGPYEVLERNRKCYKIQLPLRTAVVSTDRLKPAHVDSASGAERTAQTSNVRTTRNSHASLTEAVAAAPPAGDAPPPQQVTAVPGDQPVRTSRYGRIIKPVVRFA